MYNNNFLNQHTLIYGNLIQCSVKGQILNRVNCQYWETDTKNCKVSCSLKNLNEITIQTCKNCVERKPIDTIVLNKIDNTFLNNMRNKNKILQIDPILANELFDKAPHFGKEKNANGSYEIKRLDFLSKEKTENILDIKVHRPIPKMKEHPFLNMESLKKGDPSFTEKTKNYLAAESSQALQGKVSEKVFNKRKEICMSCTFRIAEAKNAKDSIGWCKGGCGCSVGNPRAGLSQKLYMPTLSCPKGKFGPEEGRGFNIEDAVNSGKGFFKSLASFFKKEKTDK